MVPKVAADREPVPSMDNLAKERRRLVEAVIASTVGTTIEWYDFFLYVGGYPFFGPLETRVPLTQVDALLP